MRNRRQWWILVAAALLAVGCWGCQPPQPSDGPDQPDDQSATTPGGQEVPAEVPPPKDDVPDEPPAPTIPEVFMTQEQRDTCLLWVGEIMPSAELPNPSGNPQPLAGLYGEKLTIVCFWKSGESSLAQEQAVQTLADLQQSFQAPYLDKGVRVIGINEGDKPEVVLQRRTDAKAEFPNLLDPGGEFFAKIATEGVPRVYLLDAEGTVLWLDLEFSLTSHRRLEQAVQVALGEI